MKTELVKFHDTELVCVLSNNTPLVAITPLAKAIGLDAESAVRNIKKHRFLKDDLCEHTGHDVTGRTQKMFCLPIERVHGWLFSIDIAKVKPEVQPRLEMFQRECYQVLYDHFFGKTKIVVSNVKRVHEINQEVTHIKTELTRLGAKLKSLLAEKEQIEEDNGFQLGLFEAMPIALPMN